MSMIIYSILKEFTNGLAYIYQYFSGKKPQYHHVKITAPQNNTRYKEALLFNQIPQNKDRRHIHVAFRSLLEHINLLLSSQELSPKAKKLFVEEAENLFMSYKLSSHSKECNQSPIEYYQVNELQ